MSTGDGIAIFALAFFVTVFMSAGMVSCSLMEVGKRDLTVTILQPPAVQPE